MSLIIEALEENMVQYAIRVLNEALTADSEALQVLFAVRASASEALIRHPTIQVICGKVDAADPGPPSCSVGVLGLINGLFGTGDDGYGKITAIYDNEPGQPERLLRFERTVHNHH
jgi:hypothetical protein